MDESGFALVQLTHEDPQAEYLQALVAQLGSDDILLHDSDPASVVWDIKTQEGGQARSHTAGEFLLHTDGSFEVTPPKLMALQCLVQDQEGGGMNQLVSAKDVTGSIGNEDLDILKNTYFLLDVPPEFFKGRLTYQTPLVSEEGGIRYRRDIIDRDSLDERSQKAVAALDTAVRKQPHLYSRSRKEAF